MPIRVFHTHYQLVYTNSYTSSFSLISYNINYCYIQLSSLEFAFVNLYLEPELIIGFFIILQYMCWGLYLLDTFRFQGK